MRYAIVSETYPPEVNGVALTVQSLESGLRMRGHDISLVRPLQPGAASPREGETLVASLPLPRYPGLRAGCPCTSRLVRLWRNTRPDAIYVATEGLLGWSALRAARKLQIPVATGFHTRFDEYMRDYGMPWLEPVAMRWMRRFHNRAQATLVPTRELADFLHVNDYHRVRLLPRAVDTSLFSPERRDPALRRDWGVDDTTPVAIHVGRIAAEKNLPLAIRAFRALQRERPDARFVLVGDGPLRAKMAREHPDLLFAGIQRGEALARAFASADLLLFPSATETFGNVTLEAMASGIPVVAFDYGAAHEYLVDGRHGAALALHDDAAFIAAAVRIGTSQPRRLEMGRAAREAVLHLSPARVAADFDALLAELAGEGDTDAERAAA